MPNTPATERVAHSLSQREVTEARFEKLFEDADAMSIQGYLPDGTVVYWNRASELIYGYSAEEALGGNLLDLIIPEEMRTVVQDAMRWMFETGQGIPPGRLDLKHKNGGKVPVYSSHTIVSIAGQTPVLFCMDADMRSLAQAESELRIAAAAFDSQQGMVITDNQGFILRVNRSFTNTTGFSSEDVVGRRPDLLHSPKNPPALLESIWKAVILTGSWQGEIWTRHKNGEDCADWVTVTAVRDQDGRMTHFVGTLTDLTQRKEAEAKIVQLAFYDPLTNLPNRRLMQDRLHHAIAAAQRQRGFGALLFIDIDDFKTLNDTMGHAFGDLLLQRVAERLATHVRPSDTVARFGGDEFIVMLEDLGDNASTVGALVEGIGEKLIHALRQPYELNHAPYQSGASMGVALFNEALTCVEDLIKQAELAMYAAKAAGRGTLRFFDVGMQSAINQRAEMVTRLRDGLAQQQFFLHFQPQVDREGRLLGAEVLLRWNCPQIGSVSPRDFIPVAEVSGLILPLGAWVLKTACDTLVSWAQQPMLKDLMLSVNVSALQFSQADFVHQVEAVLQQTGANPQRLKLELTESMLVEKVDDIITKMRALRAVGVTFSLDDFGTGYSSLSYLQSLPLSELKIDQSFVNNMRADANSATIVQTIVALGHGLGLTVIAEGVERSEQHDQLNHLSCDHFQGYLHGRPMLREDFELSVHRSSAGNSA